MLTIGISDNHANEAKYRLYVEWLESGDAGVRCLRLSTAESGAALLGRCDGLLLSGGGDVSPALYGAPAGHPAVRDVEPERDAFETALAKAALGSGVPLLGVCRGMQLLNVVLGGTLIVDLEEAGYRPHRPSGKEECVHDVRVRPESALGGWLRGGSGPVNSSHHQAVDRPGGTLNIAAESDDGVIEALEKVNADGTIAALLVQWHPERMRGPDLRFSSGVRECFFNLMRNRKPSTTETGK